MQPLSDKKAARLSNGTRLAFRDKDGVLWVGTLDSTNATFNLFRPMNIFEEPWTIGIWSLYSLMTDEDFVLWKLEQKF